MTAEIVETILKIANKDGWVIDRYRVVPPVDTSSCLNSIGLDPGTTHLGVAYIWKTLAFAFEVKIVRQDDPVQRILGLQDILSACINYFDFAPVMTIEGSSFGSNYRNTELAEVRASAVLWAVEHNIRPRIVPPAKIRKAVFGNGRVKAEETWTHLPPNAASALACACYPFI